nr:creatininase family protein [Candidatus Sigynarchaeota archaeon]
MRLDRIREVLKTCPVAVQPSGLLEWHGEHNAIGLDGLKAYYICERAMELLGNGALMPINWVGTYGFTRYPGSVVFDQGTTFAVFVQLFQQLIKIGFKIVFVLTGHYGTWQMHELSNAKAFVEKELEEKHMRDVRLVAVREVDLSLGTFPSDHAQRYETSMLWRAGQSWGIDLVDVRGCKLGEERPPWYPVSDEKVPLREP